MAADSTAVKLYTNPSAELWAQEFANVVRDKPDLRFEHDFLCGWFANALEAGRHAGERGSEDKVRQAVKDEHDRAIAGVGYLTVVISESDKTYTAPELLEIWEEGYLCSVVDDEDDEDDQD